MTSREFEEYRALRDTIRERTTNRFWIVLIGFVGWAFLAVGTAALAELPIATLAPLLVLLLAFEISFAIHTGVERIGRYLQVFFEDEVSDRGWEHTAMEFGRRFPQGGPDPLLCLHFWSAIALNLVPAALAAPAPVEWLVVGTGHALAVLRVISARRQAQKQRSVDLERFKTMKGAGSHA